MQTSGNREGALVLGLRRWVRRAALALAGLGALGWSAAAQASPVDDVSNAYFTAADQVNEINLDGALATLDEAVAKAQAEGYSTHPALAAVHAMRAGIIFSDSNQDRASAMAACIEAIRIDYNVKLPIELRSAELQQLCDEGRSTVAAPAESMIHTTPAANPKSDVEFVALANIDVVEGSYFVVYIREAGTDGEFEGITMDSGGDDSNWAYYRLTTEKHGGKDVEYFFYVFDAQNQGRANLGDTTRPMLLKMDENAIVAGTPIVEKGDEKDEEDEEDDEPRKKRKGKASGLPRVFINLGIGTGVGIARGTAEQTYEQYTPGLPNAIYGTREQACAVERWFAAGSTLASDPITFRQHLEMIRGIGATALPFDANDSAQFDQFVNSYDPNYCSQRHPVSTGLALAPFHIAPEIGVRVGRAVVLSVYGRLQVVTGSRVETDDPGKQVNQSFNADVRSPMPAGTRQRPPFTFAVGLKAKYFFGKDERKFRVYAGGFAGYGFARLRVPMGFSNDRNGNSVPDAVDTALHGPLDGSGNVDPDQCTVVWPYNAGCQRTEEGDIDRNLALAVRSSTQTNDERVDTVVIGPGMVGAIVGFNYQIVKNFAIFAELNIGGWFPQTTSVLFDINLGPAITF